MRSKNENNSTHQRPSRNIRETSRESLAKHAKSGKAKTEKQLVLSILIALSNKSTNSIKGLTTRGLLKKKSGLPFNHITRVVKDLIDEGVIRETEGKHKCPTSGVKVKWLEVNNTKSEIFDDQQGTEIHNFYWKYTQYASACIREARKYDVTPHVMSEIARVDPDTSFKYLEALLAQGFVIKSKKQLECWVTNKPAYWYRLLEVDNQKAKLF